MKNILILSVITLGFLGCKMDASTEFVVYSKPSQAEGASNPQIDLVEFSPIGDSIRVSIKAYAGVIESFADAANIVYGLVRSNEGEWDTLSVDSTGSSYWVSKVVAAPDFNPTSFFDLKVVDVFGRMDSLFHIEVSPMGRRMVRMYSSEICGGVPSCLVGGESSLSSSTALSSSSLPVGLSSSSSSPVSLSSSVQASSSVLLSSSSSSPASSSSVVVITYGSLVDTRDSKTYKTVVIGSQTWMAENLDYGIRVNGTASGSNQSQAGVGEKYCYGDDPVNCVTNGGLYQWAEAMNIPTSCNTNPCNPTSGNHQGICPASWHIPKPAEWDTLGAYLGSTGVGDQMKTSLGWPTTTGTNSSGFSALPAGYRFNAGGFGDLGTTAYFWEANGSIAASAGIRYLDASANLLAASILKTSGFSVRCVQD